MSLFRLTLPTTFVSPWPKSARRAFGYFGLAFGSLFVLVGIGVTISIAMRGFAQRATSGWTQTQGQIIDLEVKFDESHLRSSPLLYKYEVQGNVYRSTTVVLVDAMNLDYETWLGLANGLPESGKVDVFYNPMEPSQSVLRTGDAPESWNKFWFGGLFATGAALWMTTWWGLSNWLPDLIEASKNRDGQLRDDNPTEPTR
ncbi:MAG: DUF3592 domain-containing protein [Planctomycetota bacterium]